MHNLDNLIPQSIIDLMQLSNFDFDLTLLSTPYNNKWPMAKVTIGDLVVFNGLVVDSQEIKYSSNFKNVESIDVFIEYYNKQDNDTLISDQGEIIENQSITISKLCVNNVDLITSQVIYNLGMFHQNLSPEKTQYFIEHNLDTGPNHTLYLCENGVWKLNFKFPVVYHFVKYKAFQARTEKWPNPTLMNEIYNLVQEIRVLEQQKRN